jgi:bis(5'-adenosyl)-triphosphatase
MGSKENCPFCNSDVTDLAFAKKNELYAIYSHAPVVPGHSLIIPAKHLTDLFELSDADYKELFLFARDVIKFLNNFFKTNEFDLSLQQGRNAGQSVDHLHLHILPRKHNDLSEGTEWYHKINEDQYISLDSKKIISDEKLKDISEQLRQAWNK